MIRRRVLPPLLSNRWGRRAGAKLLAVRLVSRWRTDRDRITVGYLIDAVRRRWVVAALGVLATGAGCYWAVSYPGVYYQQADMIFIAPATPGVSNPLQEGSLSLVSAAGLVARELPDTSADALSIYTKVTIVDKGIRQGAWVRLPNDGGQWATNFDQAVLDVQVVGSDPRQVRMKMATIAERIRIRLRDGQLERGAPAGQLIEVGMSPPSPPVVYKKGSAGRALVAAFVLGLALSLVLVVIADRLASRHPAGVVALPAGH